MSRASGVFCTRSSSIRVSINGSGSVWNSPLATACCGALFYNGQRKLMDEKENTRNALHDLHIICFLKINMG